MIDQTMTEMTTVQGSQLLDQVKRLVHEGNVRRVIIKQDGCTVAEFPLAIGVVGVVFAPVLAAVGALAALLTECTLEVERLEGEPGHADERPAAERLDEPLARM